MSGCMQPLAEDRPVTPLVPGVVTAVTMTVAFGLLALGFEHFWIAFVVGFGGVLPISVGLAKRGETADSGGRPSPGVDAEDALDELRQRYARGELTDTEFEHRLERLLETESLADARETVENGDPRARSPAEN